ncbi:MAG: type IV pilus secretin PilQ [Rhodocyclaceae bacterium]|nr:type IV pilus secretin PilQ [Rhodocyclaceae bacterium]
MKSVGVFLRAMVLGLSFATAVGSAAAQPAADAAATSNSIENLQVSQQGANTVIKVSLRQMPSGTPASYSTANPARIFFDFPSTANGLGRSAQQVNEGDLRSFNIVQVGDRTRLVLNLRKLTTFETRTDDKALFITLAGAPVAEQAGGPVVSHFAEVKAQDVPQSVRDVNFRRGKAGEARITVDLSSPNVGIDIRQQGSTLIVDFLKASLPEHLRKRLDVTDFATPVTTVNTLSQGENTRMIITPKGLWEHNAYQSDNQFVVEIKPVIENPNKLIQGTRGGYQGEKLSLNFQNVEVRAVLQVIADFTNFNIITSDTVGGNLTLRLKDVPWDQALDIILQAKGLDMRKNGNVIWIAPRDELAAKEKLELESKIQISDLEPVRTESFQVNYHKAKTIFDFLKNKDQTVLSKRGSVIVDERSNKLFATDTPSRLDELRRLLSEIDVPVRQVLIEARIVEASDSFAKNLGARLGIHDYRGATDGHRVIGGNSPRFNIGGKITDTGFHTGQTSTNPDFLKDAHSVNLPAAGIGTAQVGAFSFILFNSAKSQFLNLELSALEADGKGKIVSSPRVVTADQVEALIEQGTEIPYQQATSSGATSVAFRKASLALKVKPQITPDGRIMMSLDINKDSPNTTLSTGSGVAIDTKHVKTDVLVENGGTVVIGGIYTQEERNTTTRIPLFGDLPYVGFLFRNNERVDNRSELLVFITPKIVSETLSLR